jgi:flavin-dependent dehydrogenase
MRNFRTTSHDVVIIGASLAGSTAAYLLGSRGFRCALIDKQDFPRQKACGGGLSRLALPYLQALGIEPHQIAPAQAEFFGFRFSQPASTHTFEAITPHSRGWGVSRAHLDTLLLNRARAQASVEVYLRESLRSVQKAGDIWDVSCRSMRSSAPYILFAGGSCIPTAVAPYLYNVRHPSTRRGYSVLATTSQEITRGFVSIVPYPAGEAYTTSLGNKHVNVSFVGTPHFIQHQRSELQIADLCSRASGLELETIEQIGGAGYFQHQHRSADPSFYLAGDAQESFDPACGLGMLHAIISGFRAAHSIETALHGEAPLMHIAREYERSHTKTACRIRRFSSMIQGLLHLYRIAPRAFSLLGPTSSGRLLDGLERCTVGELATLVFGEDVGHTKNGHGNHPSIAKKRVVETV